MKLSKWNNDALNITGHVLLQWEQIIDGQRYRYITDETETKIMTLLFYKIQDTITGLLWQKPATLKHLISHKLAKCVSHVQLLQYNVTVLIKYLSAGRVFLLKTRIRSRTC